MNPTDAVAQLEADITTMLGDSQLAFNIITSLVILIGYYLLKRFANGLLNKRELNPRQRYYWTKIISYSTLALALILLGGVWVEGVNQLATIIAIILAGLAIALQEPISSLSGWFFILFRKPFALGDRVEVHGTRGDVANIGPFVFTMIEVGGEMGAEQPSGRVVHVPNSFVFSHTLANSTQGFTLVWDEIPVIVTFESNWEKAKSLLQTIIDERAASLSEEAQKQLDAATATLMIPTADTRPLLFTSVVDIGIELTMRYVVPVRGRRMTKNLIWEDALRAFAAEDDIEFAYPTQRIYYNPNEGKPGAGGTMPASSPGR